MMGSLFGRVAITLSLLVSFRAWPCDLHGVTGFLPENDLYLPVGLKSGGNVTEQDFHEIMTAVRDVYTPIFEGLGRGLVINGAWEDGEVNAYAHVKEDGQANVEIFGGLARHPLMTKLGLLMVACHEVGHHIAGAPHYEGHAWSPSSEGQSDYFAATFCIKRVAQAMGLSPHGPSHALTQEATDADFLLDSCQASYEAQGEVDLCLMAALTGRDVANFLADLADTSPVEVKSLSPHKVEETYSGHPMAQCRFDTFFAGAQCQVDYLALPGEDGVHSNYCTDSRPRCWYAP